MSPGPSAVKAAPPASIPRYLDTPNPTCAVGLFRCWSDALRGGKLHEGRSMCREFPVLHCPRVVANHLLSVCLWSEQVHEWSWKMTCPGTTVVGVHTCSHDFLAFPNGEAGRPIHFSLKSVVKASFLTGPRRQPPERAGPGRGERRQGTCCWCRAGAMEGPTPLC